VLSARPRLSPWSRHLQVQWVLAGRPAAHVAVEMGISRATASKGLAAIAVRGLPGWPTAPADRTPAAMN
jgi:hypothetical protein